MTSHRLYKDLAWLWPLLSPPSDYRAEAAALRRLIDAELALPVRIKPVNRPTLLDLGCGAGHLHSHLTKRFNVTGVDISNPMLRQARLLNPTAAYIRSDIRTLKLKRAFDAVLLHDAVSYMTTRTDLLIAFKTIHEHLNQTGVGIVLPDYLSQTIGPGESAEAVMQAEGSTVHVMSTVEPGDSQSGRRSGERFTLTMTFAMINNHTDPASNRGHKIVTDRHVCGLFDLDTWLSVIDRAGLTAKVIRKTGIDRKPIWKKVTPTQARAAFGPGEGEWGFVVSRRAG